MSMPATAAPQARATGLGRKAISAGILKPSPPAINRPP